MDPSDFYIGLWLSSICRSSPPAGKPNPTRALRRSGIGVDGVVSSVDMLRICRAGLPSKTWRSAFTAKGWRRWIWPDAIGRLFWPGRRSPSCRPTLKVLVTSAAGIQEP